MSAHETIFDAAVAEKFVEPPASGTAIGCKYGVTVVPIVTTTTTPSTTTLTYNVSADVSTLGADLATMDRATGAAIVVTGTGGAGVAGSGGNGGGGGGGGEYAAWAATAQVGGSLASSQIFLAIGDSGGITVQIGNKAYNAANGTAGSGTTAGAGGATGDTTGSASSSETPTTTRTGGAGGAGQTGAGAAGGGGGEAAGSAATGNDGAAGSGGTGGAGGTGTAGADGGAGGSTGAPGVAGTAPGGGGGGGANGQVGAAGGAGQAIVTFTPVAESNTLPNPTAAGVKLILWAKTLVCNRVITATTAFDSTGNNVIALNTAGDVVVLKSVPSTTGFKWQLIKNSGAVLWAA